MYSRKAYEEAVFEDKKRELSQWYTPQPVANKLAEWALYEKYETKVVLEPCAGTGNIVRALSQFDINVLAVEYDLENIPHLKDIDNRVMVMPGDFLDMSLPPTDLTVMNPPYEHGQDVDFILKAFQSSKCVVSILRAVAFNSKKRWDRLWRFVDVHRVVHFVDRVFKGAKQDYAIVEMTVRTTPRRRGEKVSVESIEWW